MRRTRSGISLSAPFGEIEIEVDLESAKCAKEVDLDLQ